jgi:hypothetical protein
MNAPSLGLEAATAVRGKRIRTASSVSTRIVAARRISSHFLQDGGDTRLFKAVLSGSCQLCAIRPRSLIASTSYTPA